MVMSDAFVSIHSYIHLKKQNNTFLAVWDIQYITNLAFLYKTTSG